MRGGIGVEQSAAKRRQRWPRRNPKGCKESSRWSESAETTGSDDETNRTPEGCQIYAMNIPGLKIRIRREWPPVVLHPSRGAVMTNDFSGGLRGLRPPATFFGTLRVVPRSVSYINALASLGYQPSEVIESRRGDCD